MNNFEVVSDSVGSPKLIVYFFLCVTEKSDALDLSFCCVLCKRGLCVCFFFSFGWFFLLMRQLYKSIKHRFMFSKG